jgi:hypothetical protein
MARSKIAISLDELLLERLDLALSVERIGKKLGLATPEELGQVIEGLNEIIG